MAALSVNNPVIASGERPSRDGVEKLWSAFPLTTQPNKVSSHGKAAPEPAGSGPVRTAPSRDRSSPEPRPHHWDASALALWIAVAMAGAALLAWVVLRRRSKQGGMRMVEFFRSRTRRTDDGDEPAAETEWVSTGPGIYQPVTDTAGAEVARTEPSGEAPPFETLAAEPGRLGEHVASIVAAAEAAADKIRAEAGRGAEQTRSETARLVKEMRTRVTEETEAERAEARRMVEEAKAAAEEIRAEADGYADGRRREADARAAQTVRDAEERAAAIAGTAGERNRVLLTNVAASEVRLRELAESLRTVASSLDEIVEEGESMQTSLNPARRVRASRGQEDAEESANSASSSIGAEAGV
jgi:hypothetical protein